jgi:hypothetical protein
MISENKVKSVRLSALAMKKERQGAMRLKGSVSAIHLTQEDFAMNARLAL